MHTLSLFSQFLPPVLSYWVVSLPLGRNCRRVIASAAAKKKKSPLQQKCLEPTTLPCQPRAEVAAGQSFSRGRWEAPAVHQNVWKVRGYPEQKASEKERSEEANSRDKRSQVCPELLQDLCVLWPLHSFYVVSTTLTFANIKVAKIIWWKLAMPWHCTPLNLGSIHYTDLHWNFYCELNYALCACRASEVSRPWNQPGARARARVIVIPRV